MDTKNFIKTSDIDLASTLYTMGFPINGIYATGIGEQMDFYLEENNEIKKAIGDYWKGNLRVEPRLLLLNRREILTRMKARQNEENIKK